MVDPVAAFHGISGDLPHELPVSVAADEDDVVHPQFAGLLHDKGHFLAHVGENEHLGLAVANGGQLGPEVDVGSGAEALVGDDITAVFLVILHEELAKTLCVVAADVIKNGCGVLLELLGGEGCYELTLVGVGEACADMKGLSSP